MFQYDKIAIGCTLSSALYCFYNQIPLIFVERQKIHPFEFFEPNTDLSLLKIEPLRYDLKKPENDTTVFGASKEQVYEKMLVLLSLSGLVPFSNLAKSVNIGKKEIKVITERNKVFNVGYNSLIVFDDTKISGLSSIVEKDDNEPTQILDWFEVNTGCIHDIDYIQTDEEFVKEIYFYPSQRATTSSDKKDLLAISYISEKEAKYEYQYSDTYARFKVVAEMKKAGIRGQRNGKNPNYPERSSEPYKWVSPKIKLIKREIVPLPMSKYRNTKKIRFCYDSPEKIIEKNKILLGTYTTKLLNAL
mgnify:FL=1|jgi:hypothetical protein|tara:strand:- start:456 stop:1364 length:909 start_codon:yes stop_codon:yes gene_type:complete